MGHYVPGYTYERETSVRGDDRDARKVYVVVPFSIFKNTPSERRFLTFGGSVITQVRRPPSPAYPVPAAQVHNSPPLLQAFAECSTLCVHQFLGYGAGSFSPRRLGGVLLCTGDGSTITWITVSIFFPDDRYSNRKLNTFCQRQYSRPGRSLRSLCVYRHHRASAWVCCMGHRASNPHTLTAALPNNCGRLLQLIVLARSDLRTRSVITLVRVSHHTFHIAAGHEMSQSFFNPALEYSLRCPRPRPIFFESKFRFCPMCSRPGHGHIQDWLYIVHTFAGFWQRRGRLTLELASTRLDYWIFHSLSTATLG